MRWADSRIATGYGQMGCAFGFFPVRETSGRGLQWKCLLALCSRHQQESRKLFAWHAFGRGLGR